MIDEINSVKSTSTESDINLRRDQHHIIGERRSMMIGEINIIV